MRLGRIIYSVGFDFKFKQSPMSIRQKPREERACNCRNSKCRKMYCECFLAGLLCNPTCKCKDCENNLHSQTQQLSKSVGSQKQLGGDAKGGRGCQCRKSMCIKKYCECFQYGNYCGESCKCVDCQNNATMANSSVIDNLKSSQEIVRANSLYPIIVSQGPEQLEALLAEDEDRVLRPLHLEANVAVLFAASESGQPRDILEHLMSILTEIESSLVKQSEIKIQEINQANEHQEIDQQEEQNGQRDANGQHGQRQQIGEQNEVKSEHEQDEQ